MFQSTPAHGGRHSGYIAGIPGPLVSIHARTRRATLSMRPSHAVPAGFNPRPHTAGDKLKIDIKNLLTLLFQSTPAHGGRLRKSTNSSVSVSFNPRPHTAGDKVQDF